MSTTYRIRINNGPEREFVAATSMYMYAALAAVLQDQSLLPLPTEENGILVEIWVPYLVPEYGPYHYLIWEDRNYSGRINVVTAVKERTP